MTTHARPHVSLATLAALLPLLACTEPEPGSCSTNESLALRACVGGVIDVAVERARLGTITGTAQTGYSLAKTGDDASVPVDFRYGAAYVVNATGEALANVELRPVAAAGDSPSSDPSVYASVADNSNAWVALDANATRVGVWVDGSFVGERSMTDDATDPSSVAANVVELNCAGIRRFTTDADGEGTFRDYVTLLEGSNDIIVSNTIDPTLAGAIRFCVYAATLADGAGPCPDWADPSTYDWTTLPGDPVAADEQRQVTVAGTGYVALGFMEAEADGSCPDPATAFAQATDVAPGEDLPRGGYSGRKVIRIADSTQSVVRFEKVEECGVANATAEVPVAVPLLATACDSSTDASGSFAYTFYNCTDDLVRFNTGPELDGEVCMLPDGGSSTCAADCDLCIDALDPYEHIATGTQLYAAHWWTSDDPTAILKKKTKPCE